MTEKGRWWREEPITADPKEQDLWGLKEDLSLRTLKRNLSMGKLQRTLITAKPKDNAINEDSQELQDPQWLLSVKLTTFGFLVMVYDSVDDGDKFLSFFCFLILLIQQLFANEGNCIKTRWRNLFGTRSDMKFVRWILENPH